MRKATLAAAAMAVVCARAEAYPVTFTLANGTYNQIAIQDGGFRNGTPLGSFQLTIDSAAVARGSFRLQGSISPGGGNIMGDQTDFISASTPFGDSVSPTSNYSTFGTSLTFDSAGTASGVIDFGTAFTGLHISGSAGQFAGTFGGDNTRCGATACGVSGQLRTTGYTPTAVPEPLSAALLLPGLAGIILARRRA